MKSVQDISTSTKFEITHKSWKEVSEYLKIYNETKLSLAERTGLSANVINKSVHLEKALHLAIESLLCMLGFQSSTIVFS